MSNPDKLRILLFDLETAPMLAYIWRPNDEYITYDRLIQDSFLIAWSAKWHGEKKIHAGVLTTEEATKQDDKRIVMDLAAMIRDADIIVAHNVNGFDLPMFNNRLLALKLEPIGPMRTIDTLTLAKKNFRLAYNKLDYLADFLGLGRKLKTDFALWRAAYHGEATALARMSKYNVQDVRLLEKVFDALRPYVKNLPRLVEAVDNNDGGCPSCGDANLIKRGYHRTNAATYQRWHCRKCGRYSRSRSAMKQKFTVAPM